MLIRNKKQSTSYAERKFYILEKDLLINQKVDQNKIGEETLLFAETFQTEACHNQKQETSKKIWRKENSL